MWTPQSQFRFETAVPEEWTLTPRPMPNAFPPAAMAQLCYWGSKETNAPMCIVLSSVMQVSRLITPNACNMCPICFLCCDKIDLHLPWQSIRLEERASSRAHVTWWRTTCPSCVKFMGLHLLDLLYLDVYYIHRVQISLTHKQVAGWSSNKRPHQNALARWQD